jgi:hypothetical protein
MAQGSTFKLQYRKKKKVRIKQHIIKQRKGMAQWEDARSEQRCSGRKIRGQE